jgi:hypothetical protein
MGRKSREKQQHRAKRVGKARRDAEPTLGRYVGGAMFFAIAFSLVAVLRVTLGGGGWRSDGGLLPLVIGGYFAAALCAALVLWTMRRVAWTARGWAMRGMVVAFFAYGAAIVAITIAEHRGAHVLPEGGPWWLWLVDVVAASPIGIPAGILYGRRVGPYEREAAKGRNRNRSEGSLEA